MRGHRTRRARRHGSAKACRAPGAVLEVTIIRIGADGDGIAEHDGQRLYVPYTVPGERVRARTGIARSQGLEAELLAIIEPHPGRVQPPCPHFRDCGGCSLQHLSDALYAGHKRDRLVHALRRAGLEDAPVLPLAQTTPGTRTRATFAAAASSRPGGAAVLGFCERRGHRIVDLQVCMVLHPQIMALLPALRRLLTAVLSPRQRTTVAVALLEGGLDVVLEWPGDLPLLLREHLAAFAEASGAARVSWRQGEGYACEPVVQRQPLGARYGALLVPIPPGAFRQPSAEGETCLVDAVRTGVGSAARIADLFSGTGTFAVPLAMAGARVHAVDGDADAIGSLLAAARTMPALSTETRDLFARPLLPEELRPFDAVVFDPPRAGARAQAEALARSAVPTVVAVSCNPDTFARDARALAAGGYRLQQVTPIDQFLWSPHLELVAVFSRALPRPG